MNIYGRFAALRPLTVEDAEITLRWRLGQRAQFLQRGSQTIGQQRRWIESSNARGDLNFIIESRGTPVGMESIVEMNDRHKTASLGRLLIGEEIGQTPVALESDLLLSDYAFNVLGMEKLYGDIMVENTAMIRTRLYLGYRQDGILRSHYIYDGVRKDTVAVSILKDEYFETCRPRLIGLLSFMSGENPKWWTFPLAPIS